MKCKDCNVDLYTIHFDQQGEPEVLYCPECGEMVKSESSIQKLRETLINQAKEANK